MNFKRGAAVALTGLLVFAGTVAVLAWAPYPLAVLAFVPGAALLAVWEVWLGRIPALKPRPGELVRVNALGLPVRFRAVSAGSLSRREAAEMARRDAALGLLGSVSGAGGPKPLGGPLPPTVALALMREAAERMADTGDISAAMVQAEISARGPWN